MIWRSIRLLRRRRGGRRLWSRLRSRPRGLGLGSLFKENVSSEVGGRAESQVYGSFAGKDGGERTA